MDLLESLTAALADRYTIERELGRGGNATVYLALDRKHKRKVAVKVLLPELAQSVRIERFLQEIEIAAGLTHPHILPIYDSGQAQDFLYYVMPYVAGESLRERLTREKQLPVENALRIARDVAEALAYAHSQGVVHRDIKPENILLSEGGAVVADFGIARALSEAGSPSVTATGIAVGTPLYMSPEQGGGSKTLDGRSDVYSLACVLYEMLAGQPPFTGESAQEILAHHALDPVPRLRRTDAPRDVVAAIGIALGKRPAERFATAAEFAAALSGQGDLRRWRRWPRRRAAAVAAVLAVLLTAGWFAAYRGASAPSGRVHDAAWAGTVAPREIVRLAESGKWDSAWSVARSAERLIPDDTTLRALWPRFARRVTIGSDPAGATVYRNSYVAAGPWDDLGRTPLERIWIPNQMSRLRLVKEGYDTVEVTLLTSSVENLRPGRASVPQYQLFPRGTLAQGMVHVRAGAYELLSPDLLNLSPLDLHAFLVDKYEVTNRQYKEFVLAGGYRDRRHWQEPFIQNGRPLRWEEGVALFVDRTARPGPATWEAGDYPSGREDDPVSGLSWYEAAAYARFRGKSLPTIYHWYKASGTPGSAWVVPYSNFGRQGPTRTGTQAGLSEYGAYDMAGNVREWCINESSEGERYILGGGWSDAEYLFHRPFALSPWDRSQINGMRLVRYLHAADPGPAAASITIPHRDFAAEKPVSDANFRFYRALFEYDRTPLHPKVEVIDSTPDWIVESAAFTAAYGDERMRAVVFLPRHAKPPYQTVMFFPGAGALFRRSTDLSNMADIDFLIKSGRAVIYPIYKGTYDRGGDNVYGSIPDDSHTFRDQVIMWAKDLRRSIDYAETRADLDLRKLVYYGRSWGGRQGPIMVAVEPRFQSAVLFLAGLTLQRTQPEADPFNYAPRITVPVLLLSGRYDYGFPYEASSAPLFRLLGTPPEHKRHVVGDGGHFIPRTILVKEVLDWLDRYAGPVPR